MDFISSTSKAMEIEPKMEMMGMQSGDVLATWANIDAAKESFDYALVLKLNFELINLWNGINRSLIL